MQRNQLGAGLCLAVALVLLYRAMEIYEPWSLGQLFFATAGSVWLVLAAQTRNWLPKRA